MSRRVIPTSRSFVRTRFELTEVLVCVSPKLHAFCHTLVLHMCQPGMWGLTEITPLHPVGKSTTTGRCRRTIDPAPTKKNPKNKHTLWSFTAYFVNEMENICCFQSPFSAKYAPALLEWQSDAAKHFPDWSQGLCPCQSLSCHLHGWDWTLQITIWGFVSVISRMSSFPCRNSTRAF